LPDLTQTDIVAIRPVILVLRLFTPFRMFAAHQNGTKMKQTYATPTWVRSSTKQILT